MIAIIEENSPYLAKGFRYKVFTKTIHTSMIQEWLNENVGPFVDREWDFISIFSRDPLQIRFYYIFKDEQSAILFFMKWG